MDKQEGIAFTFSKENWGSPLGKKNTTVGVAKCNRLPKQMVRSSSWRDRQAPLSRSLCPALEEVRSRQSCLQQNCEQAPQVHLAAHLVDCAAVSSLQKPSQLLPTMPRNAIPQPRPAPNCLSDAAFLHHCLIPSSKLLLLLCACKTPDKQLGLLGVPAIIETNSLRNPACDSYYPSPEGSPSK